MPVIACNKAKEEGNKIETKTENIFELIKTMINDNLAILKNENDLQFKQFDIDGLKTDLATKQKQLESSNKSAIKLND